LSCRAHQSVETAAKALLPLRPMRPR
jgi:hypothetical protein